MICLRADPDDALQRSSSISRTLGLTEITAALKAHSATLILNWSRWMIEDPD